MGAPEASAATVGRAPPALRRIAVVQSVIGAASVREALAERYAPAPVECRLLRSGLNDTYLVVSPRGRCVARVYGRHRTPPEIGYELELLLHLGAKGVVVCAPVPAADGSLTCVLHAPEGPRELALFPHTGGGPMTWRDRRHCRLAGRLAARIHAGADDFATRYDRSPLDLEQLADARLRALRPFFAHRPADWASVVGIADRLRAALARDDGLDWGPCHGDLGAKNIHVAADGTLTAIDFDLCGPGWRAYDLAPAYRAAREAGAPDLWEAFVRGYADERPVSTADLAAVPAMRLLRHLGMLGILASNSSRWGVSHLADAQLDGWLGALTTLAADLGPGTAARRPARRAPPRAGTIARPRRPSWWRRLEIGYSVLGEAALEQEIVRAYRLREPVSCRLLHRGLNDNYLVVGPRERYVARVHPTGAAAGAQIGYELELLAHLSGAGIGVPRPIPAGDGRPTVRLGAPEGPRTLVLFAHSAGVPLGWTRAGHGRLLGGLAARIHAAADGFSTRTAPRPLDLEHLITRPLAALRPVVSERGADWRALRRVAGELRARAEAAAGAGLDWGACHGDLRPGHVHCDERGGATVLGFDRCGPGWRIDDLSMVRWGTLGPGRDAYWRAFLAGYAEVRPIGSRELEALAVFLALRRLSALGVRAESAGRWGTRQIAEALDAEMAFLHDWQAGPGAG